MALFRIISMSYQYVYPHDQSGHKSICLLRLPICLYARHNDRRTRSIVAEFPAADTLRKLTQLLTSLFE